jgi:hypothetical protein
MVGSRRREHNGPTLWLLNGYMPHINGTYKAALRRLRNGPLEQFGDLERKFFKLGHYELCTTTHHSHPSNKNTTLLWSNHRITKVGFRRRGFGPMLRLYKDILHNHDICARYTSADAQKARPKEMDDLGREFIKVMDYQLHPVFVYAHFSVRTLHFSCRSYRRALACHDTTLLSSRLPTASDQPRVQGKENQILRHKRARHKRSYNLAPHAR